MRGCPIHLLVAAALALACGNFETPDVQHGAVTGRITGARPGAYAYVLGSPRIMALAASDGTFRLDGVPAGEPSIVLFDGGTGAESLPVRVAGATLSQLDPGRALRPAGAIAVGSSPLSGLRPTGLTFTVDGTPLVEVSGESGAAQLFPLPAGTFLVRATQPGFRDQQLTVQVGQGTSSSLEVGLEVEATDARRGCLSCGCDHGLSCNPADGQCYACVGDADCGAGGTCTAAHVCSYPAGSGRACEACSGASDCAGARAACVNPTRGLLTGYCTQACSGTQDCPSGYACRGGACATPLSCLAMAATFGASCLKDDACQAALDGGKCFPLDRRDGTAGYCSARVQGGCPSGFAPDPGGTDYCARTP